MAVSEFPIEILAFIGYLTYATHVYAVPTDRTIATSQISQSAVNLSDDKSVCWTDNVAYPNRSVVPSDGSCEQCICNAPNITCSMIKCEVKSGCKIIQRQNQCCPDYKCDCEYNGLGYDNGEKIDTSDFPCRVCYCKGGDIMCTTIGCYEREDCVGKIIPGTCCPKYDHCPPLDTKKNSKIPSNNEVTVRNGKQGSQPWLLTTNPANADSVDEHPTTNTENYVTEISDKILTIVMKRVNNSKEADHQINENVNSTSGSSINETSHIINSDVVLKNFTENVSDTYNIFDNLLPNTTPVSDGTENQTVFTSLDKTVNLGVTSSITSSKNDSFMQIASTIVPSVDESDCANITSEITTTTNNITNETTTAESHKNYTNCTTEDSVSATLTISSSTDTTTHQSNINTEIHQYKPVNSTPSYSEDVTTVDFDVDMNKNIRTETIFEESSNVSDANDEMMVTDTTVLSSITENSTTNQNATEFSIIVSSTDGIINDKNTSPVISDETFMMVDNSSQYDNITLVKKSSQQSMTESANQTLSIANETVSLISQPELFNFTTEISATEFVNISSMIADDSAALLHDVSNSSENFTYFTPDTFIAATNITSSILFNNDEQFVVPALFITATDTINNTINDSIAQIVPDILNDTTNMAIPINLDKRNEKNISVNTLSEINKLLAYNVIEFSSTELDINFTDPNTSQAAENSPPNSIIYPDQDSVVQTFPVSFENATSPNYSTVQSVNEKRTSNENLTEIFNYKNVIESPVKLINAVNSIDLAPGYGIHEGTQKPTLGFDIVVNETNSPANLTIAAIPSSTVTEFTIFSSTESMETTYASLENSPTQSSTVTKPTTMVNVNTTTENAVRNSSSKVKILLDALIEGKVTPLTPVPNVTIAPLSWLKGSFVSSFLKQPTNSTSQTELNATMNFSRDNEPFDRSMTSAIPEVNSTTVESGKESRHDPDKIQPKVYDPLMPYPEEYPEEYQTIQNGPAIIITRTTYTRIPDVTYTTVTMATLPTYQQVEKAEEGFAATLFQERALSQTDNATLSIIGTSTDTNINQTSSYFNSSEKINNNAKGNNNDNHM